MKVVNIGLIGLGVVGAGVYKTLQSFEQINIKRIAVKNLTKKRDIPDFDTSILTDDAYSIVNDPEIEVVVEVVGGVEPTLSLLKTAINNGKHIVTANKELLAKHGEELFNLAREKNVVILYEAAIAGGIPIIMPIKTILAANKINKISAILNGTTNYILTKMSESQVSYGEVLKEAQKLGYAEADPTGDVEGYDAAYKLATLATIAFNKRVDINKIYREGITKISAHDIDFAREFGYTIKLIALAQEVEDNKVDVRVHPMLVSNKNVLANINNAMNAVLLSGHPVGEVMFTGSGAGEMPTASSVVGDILALAAELNASSCPLPMMRCHHERKSEQLEISETYNQYYVSINAVNTPGVIGLVGTICGRHNINISNLLQKGVNENDTAEVVVITANSKESDVQNALKELVESSEINKINNLIRVMN